MRYADPLLDIRAAVVTVADQARVYGPDLVETGMIWPSAYPDVGDPAKPAIIFEGRTTTYRDLDSATANFISLMERLEIVGGERIAYLGKNSDIYFPVLFGCLRSGIVIVPLNWRCTANELGFIMADATPRLLICDQALEDLARAATPNGTRLLVIEGPDGLRAMLAGGVPRPWSAPADDAPAMLMYTSGTTGTPKGVVVTNRMLAIARHVERISIDYADWQPGDVLLSAMPNFHMGALSWMFGGLSRGLTCVLTADAAPANILALCRNYHVTRTFVVPTVIRGLLELMQAQGMTLPQLREIHYGASPMDAALLKAAIEQIGCRFVHHYGMTEIAGTATRLGPRDHDLERPHLLKSVGKPQPGLDIEIRRPDRSVARRGEAGEIWIRSPTLMPRYWGRPAETQEVIEDDWYRSGDGGLLDVEGFLFLTDRIKDMIVSGGENIYPAEVEAALRAHPAVLDVAVFGMPDERWGETVTAAVEFRFDQAATEEQLRLHARQLIAGYKVPKRFILGASLPRTATGKIRRYAARSEALKNSS